MGFVFLAICLFSCLYGVKTKKVFTASFLSIVIISISSANFILSYNDILNHTDFVGLPIPFSLSLIEYETTLFIYFPFLLVSFLALILSKRHHSNTISSGGIPFRLKVNNKFIMVLISYCFTLFMLVVLHIFDINWSLAYENREYLLLVNPQEAGLSLGLVKLFHNSMSFLNIINIIILIVLMKTKNYQLVIILAIPTTYILLFKLIQFSRWVPLYFAISILMLNYLSTKKSNLIVNTILTIFTVFTFYVSILGRGQYEQGLVGVVKLVSTVNYEKIDFFIQSIFQNIFGGFFITAKATLLTVSPPEIYKLLSFSFLPGSLDGWSEVVSHAIRINKFTPLNLYSELYHFGLNYYFFFLFSYFFILRYVDKFSLKSSGVISLLLFGITSFFIISSQFYPIRNSLKIITIFIIFTIPFYFRKKKGHD